MSTKTSIFLLGATGYIGGCVLVRLLAHPNASTFEITVLVRSAEKAKKLEAFGVTSVVGSYKDTALVERLAEAADVVFSCADSDDLPAIQAILSGLKKRHAKLGKRSILIHTSGTGELTTGHETKGMAITDTIYDDTDIEQIESLPPHAFHRHVDTVVVDADKEGYVSSYIIMPGAVYGIASTALVDAGIQNPYSIQVPYLIKAALARKRAGMVGKGLNVWANVHIDDIADLFIVLYDAIVANRDAVAHGREGYYFGESGETSMYDVAKEIGRVLVAKGLIDDDEPTAFDEKELVEYFKPFHWVGYGTYWGTNSRARATRSRALGWKPSRSMDMVASIKPEVEAIVQQRQA